MKALITFICIVTATLSTGCSNMRSITSPDDKNLLSGSGSIMKSAKTGETTTSTENFEEINLTELLQQYHLDDFKKIAEDQKDTSLTEVYRYKRNDLQERLIASSNQKCGAYIRTIISSKSETQTVWSSLASLFSGAALVIPHVQTAKILTAGNNFSTSVLSTYNEAYFNNLAMTVLSTGISKKREGILISISKSQTKRLSDYSVNAAIADAISYHSACNIVSGMEAAAQAISNADVTKKEFALQRGK